MPALEGLLASLRAVDAVQLDTIYDRSLYCDNLNAFKIFNKMGSYTV